MLSVERAKLRVLASGVCIDSHSVTVSYTEARDTWVRHWDKNVDAPSHENMEKWKNWFVRADDKAQIGKTHKYPEPIPILVWTSLNKHVSEHDVLHFYFTSEHALLAAGEFRERVVGNHGQVVERYTKDNLQGFSTRRVRMNYENHGKWRMQCTHRGYTGVVSKVPENWELAARVYKTTDAANAELRSKGKLIMDPTLGPRNREVGILSIDMQFTPSTWLKDMFPNRNNWHDHTFPKLEYVNSHIRVRFYRGGQNNDVVNLQLSTLKETLPNLHTLYKETVRVGEPKKNRTTTKAQREEQINHKVQQAKAVLTLFLNHRQATVAQAAWERHARILYKHENKTLFVLDPHGDPSRQNNTLPDWLVQVAQANGYTSEFFKRTPDQAGREPSCTLAAMMRTLMLATLGWDEGTKPVNASQDLLSCVVAAQLLQTEARKTNQPQRHDSRHR